MLDNKYIDVMTFKQGDRNVVIAIKKFLSETKKKYVAFVDEGCEIIEQPFNELDLENNNEELIELKVLDEITGETVFARNLTGLARLNAIFPTRKDQQATGIKPYIPDLVLYRTDHLKAIMTHVPSQVHNLNFGLRYFIQILSYTLDRTTNRTVAMFNDKVYAKVKPLQYTKMQVSASAEYIARLLNDMGLRAAFYESFIYWSRNSLGASKLRNEKKEEDKK